LEEKDIDQEEVPTIKRFYKEESTLGSKVERILEKNAECLRRGRVKKYAKERKALVYLLRKTYGKSLREITKYMTGITYSGVSRMYGRAEKEIENKEGCWIKYEEMKKEIKC
jgi:chromosomal replication initiation ATPase DnaA